MNKKNTIEIGCASAFWGDTPLACAQLLQHPSLDYIVFDYLAEVTMTLLAKQKQKDPSSGYTNDFVSDVIVPHLKEIKSRNIRLISNAGGMNPLSLKEKIAEVAREQGINLKIVCVLGDDIIHSLPERIVDMDGITHESSSLNLQSANAYLGAPGITAALKEGADIVLTGRIVDTAVVVGSVVHEFNWSWSDYDKISQATLAGHLIECGTQCTGGNYTDWETIPGKSNIGFPIVRFYQDGHFEVTKPENTGGLINFSTVAEQMVYEISDPSYFIVPDVVCDWTEVKIQELSPNLVSIKGAKGLPPTNTYKVSASTFEGYKIATTAFVRGKNSKAKAQSIGESILKRVQFELKLRKLDNFKETLIEVLGDNQESLLRISAAHSNKNALEILAKEIAPAATSLAPGITNLLGGRSSPTPRVKLVSFFIQKSLVKTTLDNGFVVPTYTGEANQELSKNLLQTTPYHGAVREISLDKLVWARSGDKGNHVNIGLIARKEEYFQFLVKHFTSDYISSFFKNDFDRPDQIQIQMWALSGIGAINILLKDCLGGGGSFSLRVDPQGKAYAQRLLEMKISVPIDLV